MKKSLIVFLCLLFFTLLVFYGWHDKLRLKIKIPTLVSAVFYFQYFFVMFLLLERFFAVNKHRKIWTTFLFGALTSTLVGGISWIEAIFLDEYMRPREIHAWNQYVKTVYDMFKFTLGMIEVSMIATWSTFIGICSVLTSRWLIQKWDVMKLETTKQG